MDTVPVMGAIKLDFNVLSEINSTWTIFDQPSSPGYEYTLRLQINAAGEIVCRFSKLDEIVTDAYDWRAGRHTIILAYENLFLYIYVDGVLFHKAPFYPTIPTIGTGGGEWSGDGSQPFTIGASVDFSGNHSDFAHISVNSLIIEGAYTTKGEAANFHAAEDYVPVNIEDKFYPQSPQLIIAGTPGAWDEAPQEPHRPMIKEDGTLVMAYTGLDVDNDHKHSIGIATAAHPLGPWTKQGEKIGVGLVGNRSVAHAQSILFEGDWYIVACVGEEGQPSTGAAFAYYKTTDYGNTYTYEGLMFTNSLLGGEPLGNMHIVVDWETGEPIFKDGYYWANIEAATNTSASNKWVNYLCKSSVSLFTGWTVVGATTSTLGFVGHGATSAGVITYRVQTSPDLFTHWPQYTGDIDLDDYTIGLPSRNYYTESTDMVTGTNFQPILSITSLLLGYTIDQEADYELFPWEGDVYKFMSLVYNPDFKGAIAARKADGSILQLIGRA